MTLKYYIYYMGSFLGNKKAKIPRFDEKPPKILGGKPSVGDTAEYVWIFVL